MKYTKSELKWIKEHSTSTEMEEVKLFIGKSKNEKRKVINRRNQNMLSPRQKEEPRNKTELFASMFIDLVEKPISYLGMWKNFGLEYGEGIKNPSEQINRYFCIIWYVIDKYSFRECKDFLFAAYSEGGSVVDVDVWVTSEMADSIIHEVKNLYWKKYMYGESKHLPFVKRKQTKSPFLFMVGIESIRPYYDLHYSCLIPSLIDSDRKRLIPGIDDCFGDISINHSHDMDAEHMSFYRWVKSKREKSLSNPTKYEKMLYEYLDVLGIEYEPQRYFYANGRHYFADAYIPSVKGIIEMDGGYHRTRVQTLKDIERDKNISSLGINICRCDNSEALDITTFIDKINTELGIGIDAYLYVV